MNARLPMRRLAMGTTAVLTCLALASCSAIEGTGGSSPDEGSAAGSDGGSEAEQVERAPKPAVTVDPAGGATGVPVSKLVDVGVQEGKLTRVKVTSPAGKLPGAMGKNGRAWTAQERLEPGTTYTVTAVAENDERRTRQRTKFTTDDLTLDEMTYPSVAPLDGETVGVGMPVVVQFDIPVTAKKRFEKHMSVTSAPKQVGDWRWVSDTQVRYRPKTYWKPGTEVTVDVDVNGINAGNGIYGQEDREVSFDIGERHVYRVNLDTHTLKAFSGGKLLRTIPISAGKPGFITRSGTKIIMSKHETYDMNSSSIGIDPDSAEGYDLTDVPYAMRLTYSGEFLHAAPWSVASQGEANVSHGCTGMSVADASWIFDLSRRGDVVEFTGSNRPMTVDNGYGDWNVSFQEYKTL